MHFTLKHLAALGLLSGYALAAPIAVSGTAVVAVGKPAGEIELGYTGNTGPNLWPDFCQDVNPGQSPVDIRPGSVDVNAGKLAVIFQDLTGVKMENNGKGIKFTPHVGAAPITFVPVGQAAGAQVVFTMHEFHVHFPGEHTLKGKFFDVEMHMIFKSPANQIAVVATFFQISAAPLPNDFLTLVEQALPLNKAAKELAPFDLASVAAAAGDFTGLFTYVGSLTTPPCSPNVLWHVMSKPIAISVGLTLAIRNEQGMNALFTQVARDEFPAFNGGQLRGAAVPPRV